MLGIEGEHTVLGTALGDSPVPQSIGYRLARITCSSQFKIYARLPSGNVTLVRIKGRVTVCPTLARTL